MTAALAVCALAALTLPPVSQTSIERVLMDFETSGLADQWTTVNDNVMGGRSTGGPAFTGDTLVFSGNTVTDGGGFSSIRTKPRRWKLQDGSGIWVRYRADGREYQIDLRQNGSRRGLSVTYRAKFQTTKSRDKGWKIARLAFEDFRPQWRGRFVRNAGPLDPSAVSTIGIFIYDGIAGPFRIEVDAIGLIPRTMPGVRRSVRTARRSPAPLDRFRAALAARKYGDLARLNFERESATTAFEIYREVATSLRRASSDEAASALATWLRRAATDKRITAARWQTLLFANTE